MILKYRMDGFLHRLISRHTFGGTVGLTNINGPAKVRMKMVGVPEDLTIHWGNSYTRDFNLQTKTVERILNRGDSISVHHTFYVGEKLRRKPVIFDGGLELMDVTTGNILVTIPFRITNGQPFLKEQVRGENIAF